MIFYAHLTAYIEIVRYEEGELVWRGQTTDIAFHNPYHQIRVWVM